LEQATIYNSLMDVMDPEIPQLSVVDLGMITGVEILDGMVTVKMIPTYAACPATHFIKNLIAEKLKLDFPTQQIIVVVDETIHWDSNRISLTGKEKLKQHRIAPPAKHEGEVTKEMMLGIECPACHTNNTFLQIPFGYTLCRAIHFCKTCNQAFEQFKPIVVG
jgi:ring-1,2-phenylacetyl-CoA epoxidase subunit PaaD